MSVESTQIAYLEVPKHTLYAESIKNSTLCADRTKTAVCKCKVSKIAVCLYKELGNELDRVLYANWRVASSKTFNELQGYSTKTAI